MRGADLLVETLAAAGTKYIFTLSGNQVMSVFDASIGTGMELLHVRHEAAAVHMADAWGRLTSEPGIALVTAGPGLANTPSALYVAKMAESPMVLLSGHAPRSRLGRGAFQEMAQAEMVGHVTKASWTATEASQLGHDVARAIKLARSGRPGPVHISLPVDLLESAVDDPGASTPTADAFRAPVRSIEYSEAEQLLDAVRGAARPLFLGGPSLARDAASELVASLAETTRVPVVCMESPRGMNDPSLGAFAEVLPEADLLVLLGKKLDFMLGLGDPPAVSPTCRIIQVAPEQPASDGPSRSFLSFVGDPLPATELLVALAGERHWPASGWYDEVRATVGQKPAEWEAVETASPGPLGAVQVNRAVQAVLDRDEDAVLVSDGGEFGQWAQACLSARHRIINGPAGAIGNGIPFALAARLAFPGSTVVAMVGDGTFGFHAMEFDTAVRCGLPFVAVVGNDATWNAEYQIQLRAYGSERLIGCELLPSRYDGVVGALGGHGEHVTEAAELTPALDRAVASGLPACVNVAIERNAAPVIRRNA